MKTLYLECNMGAAGDMLMAALYELMSESEKQDFLETMNRLFPGVEIQPRQAVTCGITGTHMDVTVRGEEEHSHDVALGCGHDHDHIHEHHHEHDHSHAHDHHHDHDHDHGHTHHHTAPADIAALRTRRDALTVRAEQLQKQISTCDARLEQNRAARTAIDTRRQQHAAVRARWQWVHALAATANGAVPGKEKIMLETYIQTAYFDRILGRANTRLLIMSGGQYELRRCARAGDNRSQTGLELEVIDHYNGTARSVKTLSGGETFAASLSLALGLSDEVQATAGGVQLEAMFVDEGFGSLDSEALQQALAALVGVSGGSRIVGIISHVAELKDRIDRQIIVTKDRSGGSRVQVQA